LKETTFLGVILFSVALSITFLMLVGLLLNELYLALGFTQPLSLIPLSLAIFALTIIIFLAGYKCSMPRMECFDKVLIGKIKNILPVSAILIILPILSVVGMLYFNIIILLLSYLIMVVLCVIVVALKKQLPPNLYPFIILSISITLLSQVLLTSKYVIGFDANLEYYVFRLTQLNGNWSFLSSTLNSIQTLNFDHMLSITILPQIYSVMMNVQGEIVFKTLYPCIHALIPLTLYTIYEKQTGKLIGLLATLFFVFTYVAFYSPEQLSLNRQIIGDLFFLLSIFLLLDTTISLTKRRILFVIFTASLAVSHYSLAYLLLAFTSVIFIVSKAKPKFDKTVNFKTLLLIFVITLSWYSFGSASLLTSLVSPIKLTIAELTSAGMVGQNAGTNTIYNVPHVFTITTWINSAFSGITIVLLAIGILTVVLFGLKRYGISSKYTVLTILASMVLLIALAVPNLAAILNATRFYAIGLLILAPCIILGGQTFLDIIEKALTKINRSIGPKRILREKKSGAALLIVAIFVSAYFLSQSGFINRALGGPINAYVLNFDQLKTSNNPEWQMEYYGAVTPKQDMTSAIWLFNHKTVSATVFADAISGSHALCSYGLVPNKLILPITNTTYPDNGSLVYLGSLNVVNGLISTETGYFNTSQLASLQNGNLIYSNGRSQIWSFSHP
jgi:uncharacterized membrane protein